MSVYKPCDIRGSVAALSAGLYECWGASLAAPLPPDSLVIVGGDVRPSSPQFRAAFIAGVRRHALQVIDLGTVPTPMVHFAQRQRQAALAAVVTASHSPPDINGLKWVVHGRPPTQEDVQQLRRQAERVFPEAADAADTASRLAPRATSAFAPDSNTATRNETAVDDLDIEPEYSQWLCRRWADPAVTLRIIADPGNGCWAGRAARLLRRIFPNSAVTAIHDQADGRFPQRNPDSAKPMYLRALAEAVPTDVADVGIAFDGDGDRLTLLDEQGGALSAEETTWLLISSFAEEWAGHCFIHDVKLSRRIRTAVARHGGRSLAQRSGHAFIRTSMLAERALFGAEISGHYFHAELDGGDDALYTACRALAWITAQGEPLSALRHRCPPIYSTGDLRLPATPAEQQALMARFERQYRHFPLDRTDGIRVEMPDGWALVRSSVTASELTFRFEGDTPEILDRIVAEITDRLGSGTSHVWQQYTQEKEGR